MAETSSPETLITAIRNSFPGAVTVYTRGACFEFYKILKAAFPDAEPWYCELDGHVYTRLGDRYYDINGRAYLRPSQEEQLIPMLHDRRVMRTAHRWMPGANFRVVRLLDD